MRPVGFYAAEPHYLDHLAPIWHSLDPAERAWFMVGSRDAAAAADRHGIDTLRMTAARRRQLASVSHVVVAGYGDMRTMTDRQTRFVFVEHGAGQTYVDSGLAHPHYAGGRGRGLVDLFLCQGAASAEANRRAYRRAVSVACGPWKLDRWLPETPLDRDPCLAISFHWNCQVVPETRWALPHYRAALPAIIEHARSTGWEVIGHGHPRAWRQLRRLWIDLGVEPVEQFGDVLDRATVYACDNSSTIFEAAATGIQPIVLNAPWYRRDVEHGLRFWSHADVGLMVDGPEAWCMALDACRWSIMPQVAERRRSLVADLYGGLLDGRAAARAADAIRNILPN